MSSSLEAKIVVLGAQGVGKTSLLTRYCKGAFNPAGTTSTVGANFLTKRIVDADSDTVVRLQLWDTAGQERFRSISRLYYRGANACILCYSITDAQSFVDMGLWLSELRQNIPGDVVLHIVGTKADLVARDPSAREVPFERCIAYVADNLHTTASSSSAGGATTTTTPPTATATTTTTTAPATGLWFSASTEPRSTASSQRSSGLWGHEAAWDACHEVSAETGEGVDEVFRVVARKLVEQNLKMRRALLTATAAPGMSGYESGMDGEYFDGAGARAQGAPGLCGGAPSGSFRVGRDRRSWIFPSGYGVMVEGDEGAAEGEMATNRSRCC
ncbi:hypothetical protein TD95_002495 [Thielaviopsis punctulata]|uniref:Ras-like GTP-binding protein n=1 Tax=Thielaviopsis punctulata TaxID=72032 RepID=A0A0F4ZE82_9PEZI|nr:hypothetical protein TD95_002495 [Thielaviopsis punctulata]